VRQSIRSLLLALLLLLSACATLSPPEPTSTPAPQGAATFDLTSPAFGPGESIPAQYTCDGQDISPPLEWSEPPDGTQSLALIADDPDAPGRTWVHWVLYNIPPETRSLPEALAVDAELPPGSQHGQNSSRRAGYSGPCPPSGTHRYFFKLYALSTVLDLSDGATKEQLLEAMKGRILAQAELMGEYSRQ